MTDRRHHNPSPSIASPRASASMRVFLGALLLLLLAAMLPSPAFAAPPSSDVPTGWDAAESDHFRYLVQSEDAGSAARFATAYSPAAERALSEIGALFSVTPAAKISIYAYSDLTAYGTLARHDIDGVDAVADPAALDISVYLPTFQNQTAIQDENAIRHATSHIVTSIASGGKLPRGFDEGIAQNVERPVNERQARIASIVQNANQRGDLVSWFDMNRWLSDLDQQTLAAQAYAVAAFLIDRYEFGALRQFMTELQTASNWQEAMRTAFARKAEDVAAQWKEVLPRWIATGWRTNIVAAFDLEPATQLLAQANYQAAKERLDASEKLFRQLEDASAWGAVQTMVAQCDIGIQAESLMTQTQQALELHTYDRAANLLSQAEEQYAQLPAEQRPDPLIATYGQLASDGVAAQIQLESAVQLSHSWLDYRDAQHAALQAGRTYSRLGDADGRAQADNVLSTLDSRQRRIVLLLGALAVLTLAWLALWLWARGPAELSWE